MREQVCLQHALRWQAEDGGDTIGTFAGLRDIQQLAEAVGGTKITFGQSLADGDGSRVSQYFFYFSCKVSMGINLGNVLSADSRFSSEYSWSPTRIFV